MAEKNDFSGYILPVGIIGLLYFVASKFGLIPDKQKEQRETGQLFADYTNPRYLQELLKKPGKTALLTQASAQKLAEMIYKSKGIFNDDEEQLYQVVKAFKYKSQISQVAGNFAAMYKKDLAAYLQSFLNENELSKIFDFWQKLPTGKI